MAESFFNRLNKNKSHKAKSAGLIKGDPLNPITCKVTKEFGAEMKGAPKGLSAEILKWQDLIVVVANDVPLIVFKSNKLLVKVIKWNICDTKSLKRKDLAKVILKIETKVKK